MKPDDDQRSDGGQALAPTQPVTPRDAAVNLLRHQVDDAYSQSAVDAALDQPSPYERTHTAHAEPTPDQWQDYHSAWQNYYQKYYEGYYTHHLKKAKATQPDHYFAGSDQLPEAAAPAEDAPLDKDEALYELRQKLLGKVQQSATKVRKSRHFIPILAAVLVMLTFLFLQYNRVLFAAVAAYVSPGSIDVQNIVVDPSNDVAVSPDPRLIIPKINVDVPVVYDVGNDYDSQMAAMTKGVAHFAIPGAQSHPGEAGNTVISGHSSNDLFDSGNYKFIFAQLEKLQVGDTLYANYNGKRYTYVVTKTEVVKPSEVSKLVYPTSLPILTLITCTPLGTATNRLLVTAEQISPNPATATAAPVSTGGVTESIPGNSPTFLERLFGRSGS